jgi:uncharacterized membrane protein
VTDGTTVVAGLPIPSTSPLFLAGVGLHVVFGITAVVAGAVAMLSQKGSIRHRAFGTVYFWALAAIFATASALATVRWTEDAHLFVLGALAFASALLGRSAARRRWSTWPRLHLAGMGGSYILLLTAFYVDNGKSLPVWRTLPPLAYWLGPAAVGLPLVIYAWFNHPLARRR